MHDDDGPRLRCDGAANALGIDLPPVLVDQRRGLQAHIVETRQEIEERITRLGDKNLVAGIAQEAEEKAVGLAGAGGQNDLFGIQGDGVRAVVCADRLARGEQDPLAGDRIGARADR